ncbi:hypothetical protein ACFL3H_08240 [Gemmatimonadota bacterium]
MSGTEGGIIVARTTGGPLYNSPPFRLEPEVVFGDPSQGEAAMMTSPRGYVEVPGGLAVFDDGSTSLKVFNDDGSLRFSMGRRGEGPGEFNGPWMDHGLTPDGKILVTDGMNQRLTRIDPGDGTYELISMRENRSWNVAQVMIDRFVVINPSFTPDMQQTESLDLVDSGFTVEDTIAVVPAGRVVRVSRGLEDDGPGMPVSQPFWPSFSWWVQAGKIAVCQGREYRIDLYDLAGTHLRTIEWDAPISAVTDTMWQAAREQIDRQFGEYGPTVWHALERPSVLPSVEGVRIDDLGRLWALRNIPSERWGGPEDQTLYWDVFTPEGVWLGTQPIEGISRYFGRDVCYVTEAREESSVVVRYRLIPAVDLPE